MELKNIFIQNLKKYRKTAGISQMELAEKCNTSTSYIGQIEIGNRFPSLAMIEKIARALEVKPYLLFFDEMDSDSTIKSPPVKTNVLSNSMKEKLTKRLIAVICETVKQIN